MPKAIVDAWATTANRGSKSEGFLGMTAVPVLAKPFTVDDLQKAVTQALGPDG